MQADTISIHTSTIVQRFVHEGVYMQTDEITRFLSENHLTLILGGGILCFISIFLPFVVIEEMYLGSVEISGISASLSTTGLFWIFLIVIAAMYYGYFKGYGEQYPYLFLAAGGLLVGLTLYATRVYAHDDSWITLSYGFFLELIGSVAVAVGGYYYYEHHRPSGPS